VSEEGEDGINMKGMDVEVASNTGIMEFEEGRAK